MIKLSKTARASAKDYVPGLIDACQRGGGVDPRKVLLEPDAYPKVTKHLETAEFLVGWFHGVAEALDVRVERLWDDLAKPSPSARKADKPKPARKPRAPKADNPSTAPPVTSIVAKPTKARRSPAISAQTSLAIASAP